MARNVKRMANRRRTQFMAQKSNSKPVSGLPRSILKALEKENS